MVSRIFVLPNGSEEEKYILLVYHSLFYSVIYATVSVFGGWFKLYHSVCLEVVK